MTVTVRERRGSSTDPLDAAERITAARALLRHPLLTATGPQAEELRLVRRHQHELRRIFADGLGYRLTVEPAAARLFKAGLGRDASRPLRRRSGRAVAPRTYALFCLTIAALTRTKAQLLVDELVAQVRSAAADAEIAIDLDAVSDRRALHAALQVLVRLGVLSERDGDLEHWADQRTQSLLDVHREILALLVAAPLSAASTPQDLLDAAHLPSSAGGARTAVRRRLLESPVLSVAALDDDHAEWWMKNRNREREWFRDRFGLELELRAEGALAVDPEDELTDLPFPGKGATRHLALLLLEQLSALARDEGAVAREPWRAIPASAVRTRSHQVLAQWKEGLRRDQQADPQAAIDEAIRLLADLGLVVLGDREGDCLVHPAAARYATRTTLADASGTGERSLFDEAGGDDEDQT